MHGAGQGRNGSTDGFGNFGGRRGYPDDGSLDPCNDLDAHRVPLSDSCGVKSSGDRVRRGVHDVTLGAPDVPRRASTDGSWRG